MFMNMKNIIGYITGALLLLAVPTIATPAYRGEIKVDKCIAADTIGQRKRLVGELTDSAEIKELKNAKRQRVVENSRINLLVRTYGDSIVLRWAPNDYAAWRYLNRVGVNILRYKVGDVVTVDTLAYALKPASLNEWRAKYLTTDSTAVIAMGTLYSAGGYTQEQSKYGKGSMHAMMGVHDDQQMRFAVAVLTSEWRRDVAEMLAMRFVDYNVKKGEKYEYIVRPTVIDSTGQYTFRVGHIPSVENKKYVPEKFNPEIGDTLTGINSVRLWWSFNEKYSTYEIERRRKGDSKWLRVNKKPYMMMQNVDSEAFDNFIGDVVPAPDTYEYRIMAHDPFGDLTQPSRIHIVKVPDIEAPRAAVLQKVVIDRRNPKDLSADVFATFHFVKDTIESDFIGFKILYYAPKENVKWRELTKEFIPTQVTKWTIEVTDLTTSQMVIAAYDKEGNVSYSLPQVVRITDVKAPDAPANFRYEIVDNAKGIVRLAWEAPSVDVDYYEVVFANDSTEEYKQRTIGLLRATELLDTIAVDVNQKYIYYKVRAIDYSTNIGAYSAPLQVLRPSMIIPGVAHIDSAWVDQTKGISMRWICSNEEQISHHILKRRVAGKNNEWQTIATFDGDSVRKRMNVLNLFDTPEYNRRSRYEYAVESFSYAGITSGLSLVYSVKFEGEIVFAWPIKLSGVYDKRKGETRIAWELDDKLPYKGEWYFCIYRKGANDKVFKFLMSAAPEDRLFNDYLLRSGGTAEYYITIQFADGRESKPSNIVKVTAPINKDDKNK